MSLSDHVSISITADTLGVPRAGFGVPMILSVNASFPQRIRFYEDLAGVAEDFPTTTSPEYLAAAAIFSQNPHPERIAIGRALGKPTQRYRIDVSVVAVGTTYKVTAKGDGVTATEVTYTPEADLTFVDGDINTGTDLITEASHGMASGAGPFRVSNSGGALPTGLSVDTNYWINAATSGTYGFATSKANAIAGTLVNITAAAGGGTHTLRRAQNDVIVAQLEQGLNAIADKNFTAAQQTGAGETDYLNVTGTAAGEWFSLEVSDPDLLKIAQDHASPATSLATDLTAIANENNTWYALYTLYNSESYVKDAAAHIEPLKKIYIADLSMSETVTQASAGTGSSDAADDLAFLDYDRTATVYHPSPAAMLGAGWLGTRLPYDPGSETWKFAAVSGVSAFTMTATHKINLRAKNCNTLESIGGTNRMWEGVCCSGQHIDTTRGLDWLEDDMQVGVYNAMAGALKVPFTDAGIALIENEVRAALERGVQRGLLDAGSIQVTVPKAKNVASADKRSRILPDVKFAAVLAGAIHKVRITGVVSV